MAQQCEQIELPYLTEGWLGAQGRFDSYGLQTASHENPVINLNTNKVTIVIGTKEKTRFTTKLKRMEPIMECNNCCFTQNMGQEFHFSIAVPQTGFYKFELYALPVGEAGPKFINVFNYLICVQNVDTYVEPFPKQFPLWKQEGCFVFEPTMLQKGVKNMVKFRYFIPKAIDVQIKANEDWNKLEKVEPNIYEGVVDFSQANCPEGSKVKLNVKFPGRNNKYDILLEYTV